MLIEHKGGLVEIGEVDCAEDEIVPDSAGLHLWKSSEGFLGRGGGAGPGGQVEQ